VLFAFACPNLRGSPTTFLFAQVEHLSAGSTTTSLDTSVKIRLEGVLRTFSQLCSFVGFLDIVV